MTEESNSISLSLSFFTCKIICNSTFLKMVQALRLTLSLLNYGTLGTKVLWLLRTSVSSSVKSTDFPSLCPMGFENAK